MPIMVKYELVENFNVSAGINWDMLLSVNGDDFKKDQFKKMIGAFHYPLVIEFQRIWK